MLNQWIITIQKTPIWVWAACIFLMIRGVKALKKQAVYIPKLFLLPLIMVLLKYQLFLSGKITTIINYNITLFTGCFTGVLYTAQRPIDFYKKKATVIITGTPMTLIVFFLFFCCKYFFAYAQIIHSEYTYYWKLLDAICSGFFSGYFLGRATCYAYRYKKNKPGS